MKKKPIRPSQEMQDEKAQIEFPSRNVVKVLFPYVYAGWEQWILLVGDRHFDSVDTDRKLQLAHLEMARERNAFIVEVGDTFDAMQGKFDPRRDYDSLRPEYKSRDYLDVIVKDAAQFLGPYADCFLVFGRGNHESSVLKTANVDLINNLVHRLNSDHGGNVQPGGYGGWIKFIFKIGGTQSVSQNMKYHHGSGGGGPVTRGVIQTNRQAVYLPDADIVINGHTHDEWYVPIARERLSNMGVVYQDIQHHIRLTTYKDEYKDGFDGFHVERWGPPKPKGVAWLRFYCAKQRSEHGNNSIKVDVTLDVQ